MFDPVRFFPDFDPAVFEQHRSWLHPHHVDDETGRIIASMDTWLIETTHHKLLIDTCIGNDKPRLPDRQVGWCIQRDVLGNLFPTWVQQSEKLIQHAKGQSPYDLITDAITGVPNPFTSDIEFAHGVTHA